MLFKNIFKFLYNEIFYNGHFQTWGSLAIVISAGQLLGITITWDLIVITYLSFYLLYLHDRYRSVEIDSLTNLRRSQHIKRIYKYIPPTLLVGSALLLILIYIFGNFYSFVFIIVVTIFGFLYPIYFKGLTKKIIGFKNFYVALVFSLLVILPNIYYEVPLNNTSLSIVVLMFIFTFLRGLMMQFFLDLKDLKGDRQEGLLTLGVVLGQKKVFKIINIMNLFTSLSLPVLYFLMPGLLPSSVLFLVLLAAWNFYFFNLVEREIFFGFVLGSGEFIYWPLFVYIGQLILG